MSLVNPTITPPKTQVPASANHSHSIVNGQNKFNIFNALLVSVCVDALQYSIFRMCGHISHLCGCKVLSH